MGNKSLTAVDRSSSILDRASPIQNQPLTEAQALTDQLVSVSIQEGTNLKTAAAMLGAGWVGRATRIGAMTSLPGQVFARGASYVPAMAAESAAFAGIERGFHPSSQPFQKDWARAALTLTPLKALGGLTRTQNIVVQHLFTDLGLVAGQHGAYIAGIAEKPQGPFAEQMIKAEATNWHMKGSLAFAHGFSPRLSASEKSLEIFLKSQETNLFPEGQSSPFFSQLAMAGNGERGGFSVSPREANEWKMASKKDEGGEGSGGGKDSGKFGEIQKSPDPSSEKEGSLDGLTPGVNEQVFKGLMENVKSGDKKIREEAISKLMEFAKDGVKDTVLADVLHKRAIDETDAAHRKQGSYQRAMELEWAAARACPMGLEPSRGVLYRSALLLALGAEKPENASWIIREALREDSKGVAESEIRRSAEELDFLNLNRKFILETLEEAKRALESMKMRSAIWGPISWKSEKTPEEMEAPGTKVPDPSWVSRQRANLAEDPYQPFLAEALASSGEAEGFAALRRLVQEPGFKRWLAAMSGSFGSLITPQGKYQSSSNLLSWQRLYAAEALGSLGAKEDIDMFRAWLKDKDPRRRDLAAAALAKHSPVSAEAKLLRQQFSETNERSVKRLILEGCIALIERYPEGSSDVVNDAQWLREHMGFRSGYLDLSERAYLSALTKLPLDHPYGIETYREARRQDYEDQLIREHVKDPPGFFNRDILKALEHRLSDEAREKLNSEPLKTPQGLSGDLRK